MKKKNKSGTQSCPCPVTVINRKRRGPPCGAPSRVVRTRLVGDVTMRRRQCEKGHHFTTEEKASAE